MFEENQYLNVIYEPYHLNASEMCHSVLGCMKSFLITFLRINSSLIFVHSFNAEVLPRRGLELFSGTLTGVSLENRGFNFSLGCSLVLNFSLLRNIPILLGEYL